MHQYFDVDYYYEAFPYWYSFLQHALLEEHDTDMTTAEEALGKLLLLSEEFLSERLHYILRNSTQLDLFLDEELIFLLKQTYFLSITQHITL